MFLCLLYLCILCIYGEIPVIDTDEMNSLIFRSWYLNKRPVIINSDTNDWYSNSHFFTIRNLFLKYGGEAFECGTSTDLAMINRADPDEITLKLYLRKSKYNHYQIWDRYFIANNADKIGLKSLDIFHKIYDEYINAYTFLLGKIGSGISFQSHGSIWLHQIIGKTKIYLYPKHYAPIGGAFDWSYYTSKQWSKYILPYLTEDIINITGHPEVKEIWDTDLKTIPYNTNITSIHDIFDPEKQPLFTPYKPLEYVLSEGEIIYIPQFWWYSTLNIENEHNVSIAMIMQTEDIGKEMSLSRRGYHDSLRVFRTGFEYLYHYNDALGAKQYLLKTLLVDPTFIASYIALTDVYIQSAQKNKMHLEIVERFLKIAYLLNPEYDLVRESLMGLFQQKGDIESLKLVENKQPLTNKHNNIK